MNLTLEFIEEEQCSLHNRAFLRALLHRDYLIHRRQIYAQQISQWAQNPAQLCYVLFDYMKGPVSVDVRPWPRDPSEMLDHPDDWFHRHYNHGYRAANGKWLLEVHLMAIPNGLKIHWKIMPMRHTDPEIVNGLWSIVGKVSGIPTTDPTFDSTVAAGLEPLLVLNPQVNHE
jgi:hypothetical protein